MTHRNTKSNKDAEEDYEVLDVANTAREAKGFVEGLLKDLTKGSVTKQLAAGGAAGWVTGYLAMKVGRVAATALGGSLLLIQFASYKGYIKINWSRVNKDLEKATNKLTSPSDGKKLEKALDKAANFLDDKTENAKRLLRQNRNQARRWYHIAAYGEEPLRLQEIHVFYGGFLGGCVVGLITGNIL